MLLWFSLARSHEFRLARKWQAFFVVLAAYAIVAFMLRCSGRLSRALDHAKLRQACKTRRFWEGGVVSAVQIWNPDDWEAFALCLLQSRHGALKVHKIPAAHKGDFGIDYYCTAEAVAYQCYAVQEPIDIATRSVRQQKKITTDIGKLLLNLGEVSKLFLGSPIKHWILLAPKHDSKEVNLHCSKKTLEVRAHKCVHRRSI